MGSGKINGDKKILIWGQEQDKQGGGNWIIIWREEKKRITNVRDTFSIHYSRLFRLFQYFFL